MVSVLVAPRTLIQAQEFAWTDQPKESYARSLRIYRLLRVPIYLAELHGGPQTHATHYNWMHRIPMYKHLNRFFDMKLPTERADEFGPGLKYGGLDCFEKPVGRKLLAEMRKAGRLRQPNELADQLAARRLTDSVNAVRAGKPGSRTVMRANLRRILGDTAPVAKALDVKPRLLRDWHGAHVAAAYLPTEGDPDGPGAAVWLLTPATDGPHPVVVGVSSAGKARLLAERSVQVERLLKAGVAVCLVDVRGCGETRPGRNRLPDGESAYLQYNAWGFNESLPAYQLRDLRTALAWVRRLESIDARRVALWAEGFADANGKTDEPILFNEVGFRQTSPTPLTLSEPTAALLALLAAVEDAPARAGVRGVLLRGGLVSYMTILSRLHYYVPVDAIVPGLLTVADVPDLLEALPEGTVVLAEDLRDGSNRRLSAANVKAGWGDLAPAHYSPRATVAAVDGLIDALKK
jgi:hypothetical protein